MSAMLPLFRRGTPPLFRRGIPPSASAQPLLRALRCLSSSLGGPSAQPDSPLGSTARGCASRGYASGDARGIHLFRCPDVVGIVAKISNCIACRGGNIYDVDVFVPENKNVFYSRCEFVFDPARWPRKVVEDDFLKIAKFFKADISTIRVSKTDPKYKIAVLSSKQDHCLVDLLYSWQEGRLPVDISCVISNHDRGPDSHVSLFLERHGIPYHYLPTSQDKREEEILDLVKDTDFLVLARYMQILSRRFLESYGKDVINIHHGLLPSFKGGNPSRQAFYAGVKLIGATSHFVTEELDEGPIIEQMKSPDLALHLNDIAVVNKDILNGGIFGQLRVERVSHRDTLQSFIQKSENLEKQCLLNALKSYCDLRVIRYEVTRTVVF